MNEEFGFALTMEGVLCKSALQGAPSSSKSPHILEKPNEGQTMEPIKPTRAIQKLPCSEKLVTK